MADAVTNDLRQMMTDPTKVNYRVFVGCIPTDTMKPEELAEVMAPYGEVEGVLLNRGFGFVQFTDEKSAKAIVAANGRVMFRGRKCDVKPARPIKRPHEDGGKDSSVPGLEPADKGREASRFPQGARFKVHKPSAPERANDCEIIVVNKAQTEYAEYIEQKLRRLGLTVDLLFPNEDVPVTRVLTNIANRGCLFAVVIMPQNEEHRSMTLNILHGPPQEHRNMPLEDAVSLVSRSFEAYALREKSQRPVEVPVVAPGPVAVGGSPRTLAERHPDSIQVLLNLLADNRMLTVIQYDKLLLYLQQRRALQLKVELGDAAAGVSPIIAAVPTPSLGLDKQVNLQSRILSILNNKAAVTLPSPAAAPVQPQVALAANIVRPPAAIISAPKTQLLQDPSVQKALSNIMQGDLLRKLAEKR